MAAAPPADREPLIHRSPAAGSARRRWQQLLSTWLCVLALLSFVATAVVAVVLDRREPWKVAFGVGVLVNVVSLFGALAAYDRAPPPEGARRTRRLLKVAVWALTTSLELAFSLRAAAAAAAAASPAVCFSVGCMATFVAFAGALVLGVGGSDGPDAGGVESPNESAGGERRQREPPPAWLMWLALLFFLANAAVATIGQPRRVSAVLGVSLGVFSLVGALVNYDRAPPEDAGRARRMLWAGASTLASLLNLEFYFRAMAAPAAVSTALGCMATVAAFASCVDGGGDPKAGDLERRVGSPSQG